MKTLQDVSKVLRREVAKSIYPGVPYSGYKTRSSRAFKTGNLLTKFISSPNNQFNRIGRKVVNGYEFVLDIAPQGADYGQYVHNGTSKMQSRPYGEIGASSMEFRTEIDLFMIDRVDEMMDGVLQQLDTDFKKAGFKIS
jgi:hypothetical protein